MALKKTIQLWIVKRLLWVHSFSYRVAGFLSIQIEEDRIHPKHRLMGYHKFFVDNVNADDVVLDVGCGNGALTFDVATKAQKVVGIDMNAKSISFAKQKYSAVNIDYICGDALRDLPAEKFDVVILSNVLEHIENRVEFLEQLSTKTTRFLIRVPMINRDWITLYKKELGLEYRLDKGHFVEYTVESFEEELREVGLENRDYSVQFGEIWAIAADIEREPGK